jgi:hypothetical protein
MSKQGWRRLLPDRAHLVMVAGIAIVIVATLGFIELYNIKTEALADRSANQVQVDWLREQNRLLQEALIEGQNGDNIEPQARQYFKMARPGEKKIVFETPAVAPEATPEPEAQPEASGSTQLPSWLGWLDRLLAR